MKSAKSMKITILAAAAAAVALFAAYSVYAAAPQKINYQGYLRQNNLPVDSGGLNMEFRLFDALAGGAQLCSSGVQSVPVTLGRFNYVLGSNGCDLRTIDWHATNVYLEIIVDGNTMTPREQVVSGVYALGVEGTPEEGFVIDQDNLVAAAASMTVRFNRGASGGDAVFGWNEPGDRFVAYKEGVSFADVWMKNASAAFYYGDGSNLTGISPTGAVLRAGDDMSGALNISVPDGGATAALSVYHHGTDGEGAYIKADGASGLFGLKVESYTLGGGVYAYHAGNDGNALAVNLENAGGNRNAMSVTTNGDGAAALFETSKAANSTPTVAIRQSGTGAVLEGYALNSGGFIAMYDGVQPRFRVENPGDIYASGALVLDSYASASYYLGDGSLLTGISGPSDYVHDTGDNMTGALSVNYNSTPATPNLKVVSLGTGYTGLLTGNAATATVYVQNSNVTTSGIAIRGKATGGAGVSGVSLNGEGVIGISINYTGVEGQSSGGNAGVFTNTSAVNTNSTIFASSDSATSTVYALNTEGSAASTAVHGRSKSDGVGVYGQSDTGIGVKGYSMNAPAVYGSGLNDRAAFFVTTMNSNATDVLYVESWSGQSGSSLIGANHQGSAGRLLNLRTLGQPAFVVEYDADLFSSGSIELGGYASATKYYGDGSNLTGISGSDITRVLKTGDTMTGPLNIDANVATSVVYVNNSGVGSSAMLTNAAATPTLYVENNSTSGQGSAVSFTTTDISNSSNTVFVQQFGTGRAGLFKIDNVGSSAQALRAQTSGTGVALFALNSGTGHGVSSRLSGLANPGSALYVSSDSDSPSGSLIGGDHTGLNGKLISLMSDTQAALVVDRSGNIFASGSLNLWPGSYASATTYFGDGSNLTGITGPADYMHDTGDTMSGPLNINFNTATASLAVMNGAGDAIVASGTVRVGADTGSDGYDVNFYGTYLGGAGGRLFWDASKDALRTGRDSDGSNWNDANVGDYSFAAGYNTKAIGSGSVAAGQFTSAGGAYSLAMGYNTISSGDYSTTLGGSIMSSGNYSFSAGQWITAGPAPNTIAIGRGVNDSNRLENNISDSLMVGFNSNIPTLFVGPGPGLGAFGSVSIGSATPTATFDVRGDMKVALTNGNPVVTLTQGGNIFASGAISFDGPLYVTGNEGGAGDVLTSNGAGVAPAWQPAGVLTGFVNSSGDVMTGALGVSQGGATATIHAYQTNITDKAGHFEITAGGSTVAALSGKTAGVNPASYGVSGEAGGNGSGVYGLNASVGNGVFGENTNNGYGVRGYSTGSGGGLWGDNAGTGYGIWARNSNTGIAAYFNNMGGANPVLRANNAGSGNLIELQKSAAPRFSVDGSGNAYASGTVDVGGGFVSGVTVAGETAFYSGGGNADGIHIENPGNDGAPAQFITTSGGNNNPVLRASHQGTGRAAMFTTLGATDTLFVEQKAAANAMRIRASAASGGLIVMETGSGPVNPKFVVDYDGNIFASGSVRSMAINDIMYWGDHGGGGDLIRLEQTAQPKFVVDEFGNIFASGAITLGSGGFVSTAGDVMTGELGVSQGAATASISAYQTNNSNPAGYFRVTGTTSASPALSGINDGNTVSSYGVYGQSTSLGSSIYAEKTDAGGALYAGKHSGGGSGKLISLKGAAQPTFVVDLTGTVFASGSVKTMAINSPLLWGDHGGGGALMRLQQTGNPMFVVDPSGNVNASGSVGIGGGFTSGVNVNGQTAFSASGGNANGISIYQPGTMGIPAQFIVASVGNPNTVLTATTASNARAAYFETSNGGTSTSTIYVKQGGTNGDLIAGSHIGGSGDLVNLKTAALPTFVVDTSGNIFASGSITLGSGGFVSTSGDTMIGGLEIIQGATRGIYISQSSINHEAAYLSMSNPANSVSGLTVYNNGVNASSHGIYAANTTTGNGNAGYFEKTNPGSTNAALSAVTQGTSVSSYGIYAQADGSGKAIYANTVGAGAPNAVYAYSGGSGQTIYSENANGTNGKAGHFEITSAGNSAAALSGITAGTAGSSYGVFGQAMGAGSAIYGQNSGAGYGVYGYNTSTGKAVYGHNSSNTTGQAGYFENSNIANSVAALTGRTVGTSVTSYGIYGEAAGNGNGIYGINLAGGTGVSGENSGTLGYAGYFTNSNGGSTAPPLVVNTQGTGDLVVLRQNATDKFIVANSGFVSQQGCPTGGTWVDMGRYCINDTFFGPQDFLQATANCYAQAEKADVCSLGEVVEACRQNTIVSLAVTTNVMVDSLAGNNTGIGVGVIQTSSKPCSNVSITPSWQAFNVGANYFCCITK